MHEIKLDESVWVRIPEQPELSVWRLWYGIQNVIICNVSVQFGPSSCRQYLYNIDIKMGKKVSDVKI